MISLPLGGVPRVLHQTCSLSYGQTIPSMEVRVRGMENYLRFVGYTLVSIFPKTGSGNTFTIIVIYQSNPGDIPPRRLQLHKKRTKQKTMILPTSQRHSSCLDGGGKDRVSLLATTDEEDGSHASGKIIPTVARSSTDGSFPQQQRPPRRSVSLSAVPLQGQQQRQDQHIVSLLQQREAQLKTMQSPSRESTPRITSGRNILGTSQMQLRTSS